MRSQCARFNEDAGEIASRLQIRHQATCRLNRVTERAEHATEISGLPGFGRRRRSGRERWRMAHGAHTAFRGPEAQMRETGRLSPMRHTPPFSPRSSPPTEPGQPGYLRGMLCALRYSVAPMRDLVTDLKSRRNLVVPCARFPLDAGEIAPRSCTCAQAIGRRYHLTERAEHATEISGLPGFGRRRRSGRERWRMAHGLTRRFVARRRKCARRAV